MREGWKIVPFGNVCEISGGSQPPKDNFIYEPREGYIRLIQVRDYRTNKYITYIPKKKAKKFCTATDIMIGRYGPPIFGIFNGIEGAYNVALMKAIPDENKLNKEYLRWFLKTSDLVRFVEKTSKRAAGQDGVRKERLYSYPTPLPPLPEQKRIVSILDRAFEAIDKAKANAKQNLQNAKELFESYLQGVFENKGNDWKMKTVQDITNVINGYAFSSKEFKPTNSIKSIKITNVGVKEFVEETENYLPEKYKDTLKGVKVREGDIVIALTRTIISAGLKVAVVPKSYDGALVNQRVAALVPKQGIINQRYLYNFLITDGVAKYVLAHVNTLMQPNLSIMDLKKMSVPYPSIEEQKQIVKKVDGFSAKTKKLESIYQQKISNLEELKKSILQKAFAGELI